MALAAATANRSSRRAALGSLAAANSVVAGFSSARQRTMRLHPALAGLASEVQRGSTISCHGAAATSLALAVAAQPSADGAWVAAVGLPALGVRAAVEAGIVASRLIAVCTGGPNSDQRLVESSFGDIVAAAIDGFDIVLLGAGVPRVGAGLARRIQARVQQRGALLILVGSSPTLGMFSADLQFTSATVAWQGLGAGFGVARGRSVQIELAGRRIQRSKRSIVDWPLPRVAGSPDGSSAGGAVAPVLGERSDLLSNAG